VLRLAIRILGKTGERVLGLGGSHIALAFDKLCAFGV
jgi:hypothetical protein